HRPEQGGHPAGRHLPARREGQSLRRHRHHGQRGRHRHRECIADERHGRPLPHRTVQRLARQRHVSRGLDALAHRRKSMSISTTLFTGASGLEAHSDAISVVGDNIANASTIGFKSSRASFEDALGGAAANGQRLGGGVRMGGPETLFGQGSLQSTGNNLDFAIRGNGFFAVSGDHNGFNSTDYTRDGRFQLDNTGTVVNSDGLKLQGYTIDATGKMSTSPGNLVLTGTQSPPNATTSAQIAVQLDSTTAPPAAFNPASPATTSNYQTSMTAYDSLGNAHRVDLYFRNNGGGQWDWHAMVDGADVGGTAGTPTQIADGTLTFNSAGALGTEVVNSSSASFVGATANQAIKFDFGDAITT